MAATAGTIKFKKMNGDSLTVDVYIPDATGTVFTWNQIGLAGTGSSVYWQAPEDCILEEISVAAAPTAVGGVVTFDQSPEKNATFRHANVLSTLATRMKFNIFVRGGTQVGVTQY